MTDIAPDGSPLAFYRRLPPDGEPEMIHDLIPAGATVLDLGCGPGRIAGPLASLGRPVTGVDDGAAMVAALPEGVEGIVADARSVRLGRRFDLVLLASHLLTDPEDGPAFATTAAAHLAPGGHIVAQVYPEGYDPVAGVGTVSRIGDAHVELMRAAVTDGIVDAEVRYGVDDHEWRQAFRACLLDRSSLEGLLGDAGLAFDRWLDRPGWFVANARR
jgi:SAM-dependent methyltransferase